MCKIMEELKEEGRKEGLEKGHIEGRWEEKIEIAGKMIKKGSFTFEIISELSGLPIEEVEELASKKS